MQVVIDNAQSGGPTVSILNENNVILEMYHLNSLPERDNIVIISDGVILPVKDIK